MLALNAEKDKQPYRKENPKIGRKTQRKRYRIVQKKKPKQNTG